MSVKGIESLLKQYFTPVVEENGLELFDVEYVKEGPNWYIRIYIDKPEGITIEDCELISRKADVILDEKDPIPQAYILEVSSPGIDRPLKKDEDFHKYVGEIIDIKLYKSIDKQKEFQGALVGLVENIVTIKYEDGTEMTFERKDIASCRLAVIF